ncbi:MAG: His/Gly/Thr/Pro-type tRNA ligase C-terminal domain-containing protein, partial [Candidatus Omnitrophota bacterium]|nr:His/Gly/Thr/Pro-type tRNA ligase C-terminal domain-containing protein [Candidatus Omnitrophota bacterium]
LRGSLLHQGEKLCADCKVRLKNNVLRVLDCKNESCKEIVSALDLSGVYLCQECQRHFLQVKEGLQALEIKFTTSPHLVRGLDYYTRTVFEISHPALGAQDALGAGGRYDNLAKELGGPDTGAAGFAFGVERLLLVTRNQLPETRNGLVYLITLGEEARTTGVKLLAGLRKAEIPCDTDYENKSLKGALRKANDLQARLVLILGEDELQKNTVMLKDMQSGEQREVKREDLIKQLTKVYCSSEPANLSSPCLPAGRDHCSKNKFAGESRT